MLVTARTGLSVTTGEWGLIGSPHWVMSAGPSLISASLAPGRTVGTGSSLPHLSPVETPAGLSLVAASSCGHRLDELSAAASLRLPSALQGRLPAEKVDEEELLRAVHPVQ